MAITAVDADAGEVREGIASTYGNGYEGYLALPEGPGHRVRVCGPAACIVRTSNDAGPSLAMQRAGRIVDLDATDFNAVCGCRWQTVGLVKVTVEYLDSGPRSTLPPTDTEGSYGRPFSRTIMVPS
jgi:hypothetical protein